MANKSDIETAVTLAEIETGVRGGNQSIPLCFAAPKKRNRVWTDKEEKFLSDNYGRLSEDKIAKQLRRTKVAVKIKRGRGLHLIGMSKVPQLLTAEQVANGLGTDGKTVHLLMDTGRLPCRRLPSVRTMRVIDRLVFMKWMLNPDNWLYFKPNRVGMLFRRNKRGYGENYDFAFWENARMLILKARRAWKDQWLTPGQVVKFLKINPKANKRRKPSDRIPGVRYVNLAIHKGTLKAKRWGNWCIRKSDLPPKGKTFNFRGEIVDFSHARPAAWIKWR